MRRAYYIISSILHFLAPLVCSTDEYVGMQKFISRTDIECASWKITVYDRDALAPGYWFISPYEHNGNMRPDGPWIGPHIYDMDGELVWSGANLFRHINVMDFGVMDVGGAKRLSMSYAVNQSGVLLDDGYQIQQTVSMGTEDANYNMHDFRTVENGSRFLYLRRRNTETSANTTRQALGYDGECSVTFPGFEERDITTGEIVFKWDAEGKIPLSDSTMASDPVERRCSGGAWDFLHSNSIDKFPDGHYLLSTRHSDTIYKISKDDGSIIWRLHGHGGVRSDFMMGDLNFSRQHHARILEHNQTHTIISLLDNAVGADPQPATSPWSRGLVIALREDTMDAEIIASYDHPHRGHAYRRGSTQILPNGNVFMGWSERALQSEHTADGRLLIEAELIEHKLGTYRAFKFPFVANPRYPPDIYSNASSIGEQTTTTVYASWNGATEVTSWALYKTNARGEGRFSLLASVPRSGFETRISYDSYAMYVYVEAKDSAGQVLGTSAIIETASSGDVSNAALVKEVLWLNEGSGQRSWTAIKLGSSMAVFVMGIICGVMIILGALFVVRRRPRWVNLRTKARYERLASSDAAPYDETILDDLSPPEQYRDRLDGDVFKLSDKHAGEDKSP